MATLKCPSCRKPFTLTRWQTDFVDRAVGRKMDFIILECQLCHDSFDFNPLAGKIGSSLSKPPPRTAEPRLGAKEKRKLLATLAAKGCPLPPRYWAFLVRSRRDATIKLKGREWDLHGVDQLRKTIRIDNYRVLQIRELGVWAKVLQSVREGARATEDQAGRTFPFSRLAAGISIGCENEDILFLDPSDGYSVWCLFPSEGGTVELLQKRFDAFMARLEKLPSR